jgi:hypothetical protein
MYSIMYINMNYYIFYLLGQIVRANRTAEEIRDTLEKGIGANLLCIYCRKYNV